MTGVRTFTAKEKSNFLNLLHGLCHDIDALETGFSTRSDAAHQRKAFGVSRRKKIQVLGRIPRVLAAQFDLFDRLDFVGEGLPCIVDDMHLPTRFESFQPDKDPAIGTAYQDHIPLFARVGRTLRVPNAVLATRAEQFLGFPRRSPCTLASHLRQGNDGAIDLQGWNLDPGRGWRRFGAQAA